MTEIGMSRVDNTICVPGEYYITVGSKRRINENCHEKEPTFVLPDPRSIFEKLFEFGMK